jgi:uncharacterized protein YbjT (DUF2867 family)
MIVVTGASGQLGRKIVLHLLQKIPASEIGVSVRDPGKVRDLAKLGVRVRHADYENPQSMYDAWEGAARLLLVSSNAAATGGDPLRQHSAAIATAAKVGVQRIFYTSQVSSSPTSLFPPGRTHAATEAMLAGSGLAWTALRHGFYAASALAMNARGFESGTLELPEDGKVAWTAHDDLAAADATLLAGIEAVDGPTCPLTGSEALDLADLARLASEIMGKPVLRRTISEDAVVARARQRGVPDGAVAVMIGYCRAARAGEFAAVNPSLSQILGRPPVTIRSVLQAEFG